MNEGPPKSWSSHGIREGVREALRSIRVTPLRSGLTILGVAIGVTVVVTMGALVSGIRGAIHDGIEAAGPRNLLLTHMDLPGAPSDTPGSTSHRFGRLPIGLDEAHRVSRLDSVRDVVISFPLHAPDGDGGISIGWNGLWVHGIVGLGESPSWARLRRATFTAGRNFVPQEVLQARPVLVVSNALARELFAEAEPLGRRVQTRSADGSPIVLTVIGTFEPATDPFSDTPAHIAVLPYSTAVQRLNVSPGLSDVIVVPVEEMNVETVEDDVTSLLRSMRELAPGESNDFSLLHATQLLEWANRITGVLYLVILTLSSVGLLVGGVGVMGLMLMSVTGRTQEIGMRKSVGATEPDILWQFLVESIVLTLIGGAVGLMAGTGITHLAAAFSPVPAYIPPGLMAVCLGASISVGVVSGIVPAVRAARMAPASALRAE